ncbi:MAG: DNA (cytosine-5-)-methyltransferase [Deltaproteobacteria bacterium]|nr:DNA (cytosine-5-)-methyltransferase [Deltaproteobacteria bacterium]
MDRTEDRKEFQQIAIDRLKQMPSLTAAQREELPAMVTHWMQSPDAQIPFLSKGMRQRLSGLLRDATQPFDYRNVPYPPPKTWDFKFVDLFAGIGGFRQSFQNAGGKCVFTSEWDEYAKRTYEANYGEVPFGDIGRIDKNEIPDHDVLCAGFPCQPFSLAGVSKKNSLGRKHGFEDETQGTLFFELKEILRIKKPRAFFLENVKNLIAHDKGKTFEVIRYWLEDVLNYEIKWQIVDGAKWVPQHRERIFIVGYDPYQISVTKDDIVIPEGPPKGYRYPQLNKIIGKKVDDKFTLGTGTWDTLERHRANHAARGNGFGYGLHSVPIQKDAVTRTISARYHKDGAEILIEQTGNRPRRLTVTEAMQLQGYDPEKFLFPVSNTQAYRQIGNSVVVPAIAACAKEMAKMLRRAHS